ncbi:MAG: peptide ABC transporter substrate-binding protein [Opitutaceae bacterium]|nr:peptide ABC transporter substrate-binding protein [Opitutaceae bacterium]
MSRVSLPSASLLPAAVCCLGLLLGACGHRETGVERGIREQVLHRGLGSDVAELDPHLITGLAEINVVSALFEGLVAEDPRDLHPVPGVAERWDVSPDNRVYTFHLRPTARWSNNAQVTASDFVASFRRVLTRGLAADYATLLYVVANAEAYHKGRLTDFAQVGFAAPDERTLRITLTNPVPYFLSLLTHPAWFPVYPPALEGAGPPDRRGSRWTRPETIVGNGPFVLKEWRPNQVLIVSKSPTYWDAAAVRLQAIHFHPIDSVDTEERAFRAGQLHLTEALPVGKVDSYRRHEPTVLRIEPFLGTYFYRLNVTQPFLNDKKVRRALLLAIDRQVIVEKITRGGQQPATSFVPPAFAGYAPPGDARRDVAAARQLLAEAGYPGGQGLPAFDILFNTSENHRLIAEAVQEMWRRELGVKIRLVNMEQKTVLETRRALDYQILRSVWSADYLDPTSFLGVFASDSGNNHTGWADARYDALLQEAALTADPAARADLLRRAESMLLDEAPLIPIYYYTTVRLVHPSVQGWYPTPLDHHPYKHIWLEN